MKLEIIATFFAMCIEAIAGQPDASTNFSHIINEKLFRGTSIDVTVIEIVHIPEQVETYVAMTPEKLENAYWSKTIVRRFQDSEFRPALLGSLRKSKFRKRNGHQGDLR